MMGNKSFVFRFANVEVREREFSLLKAGEALPVEPKAFRVLLILLRNPQKLIAKEELLNAVWGDAAVTENSLTRSIALLRRLLGDDTRSPRYIGTVATVGYRWVCKVEVSEEASGEVEPSPEPPLRPRKGLPKWLIPCTAVLVAGVAFGVWYASRPLPPPRVTQYAPLTHDGHIQNAAGTDGSRIYFNSNPWGAVEQVSIAGGEVEKVPIELNRVGIWDVSPDGSSLLVLSFDPRGLWTVGTTGNSLRLITKSPIGDSQTWSPNGTHIAYFDDPGGHGYGALTMMRSDGTEVHKLLDVKGEITSIA